MPYLGAPNLSARLPSTSKTGVPIACDFSELKRLARDLDRASKDAGKALRAGMREAGNIVMADAKARVSYSHRIPGSMRVRAGRGNFKVVAGGEQAPDAAPIENRGKGFVRHPTFGRRGPGDWTNKNSHPAFLAPALQANADRVAHIVEETLYTAVKTAIEGR